MKATLVIWAGAKRPSILKRQLRKSKKGFEDDISFCNQEYKKQKQGVWRTVEGLILLPE